MLILRRTPGQSFVIGENAEIAIKVLRIDGDVIIIGVDAPKNITVNRLERHNKLQENSSIANALSIQIERINTEAMLR